MKLDTPEGQSGEATERWYQGISRYQWLVLVIASAGWVFDIYEGQIYNTTRDEMLSELIVADSAESLATAKDQLKETFSSIFLAGGMVGGLLFGAMGDRWGRKPAMVGTILMYSLFSGLTYFATSLWQYGALRFLVAMGTGGEWAVAAALVAETFPARSRAAAGGIFHASSTLGTWMAGSVAILIGSQWRYGYLVGVVPALLILWVRARVHEPVAWTRTDQAHQRRGSLIDLFGDAQWRGRAIGGLLLAGVGLTTYWAVTVAGQDLAQSLAQKGGASLETARSNAKFAYTFIQSTGGLVGLLAFGPVCQWIGRKKAFAVSCLLGVVIVPFTCYVPQTYGQLLWVLPFYGALTFNMHAGYAIYFPELFPTRLRALGSSVCLNGGRLVAALGLHEVGRLKSWLGGSHLPLALSLLSLTYLLGLVVIAFMPETKDRPLPEDGQPAAVPAS